LGVISLNPSKLLYFLDNLFKCLFFPILLVLGLVSKQLFRIGNIFLNILKLLNVEAIDTKELLEHLDFTLLLKEIAKNSIAFL
jgi:hypothetical protein